MRPVAGHVDALVRLQPGERLLQGLRLQHLLGGGEERRVGRAARGAARN